MWVFSAELCQIWSYGYDFDTASNWSGALHTSVVFCGLSVFEYLLDLWAICCWFLCWFCYLVFVGFESGNLPPYSDGCRVSSDHSETCKETTAGPIAGCSCLENCSPISTQCLPKVTNSLNKPLEFNTWAATAQHSTNCILVTEPQVILLETADGQHYRTLHIWTANLLWPRILYSLSLPRTLATSQVWQIVPVGHCTQFLAPRCVVN